MKNQHVFYIETVLGEAGGEYLSGTFPYDEIAESLENLNKAGFYAVEVLCDAVFRSCLTELKEDPWERLRLLKNALRGTKLQMRIRSLKALGTVEIPENVTRRVVRAAVRNGIDILSISDPDNNPDHMRAAIEEAVHAGAEVHAGICVSGSDEALVSLALELQALGASVLCLENGAGLLSPLRAARLTEALQRETGLPVAIRSRCSSGLAYMSYLKAVEAGAAYIVSALSSFSGGVSQPATETLYYTLSEMGYASDLDKEALNKTAAFYKALQNAYLSAGRIDPLTMGTDSDALKNGSAGAETTLGNPTEMLDFFLYQHASDELGALARSEEEVLSFLTVPEAAEKYRARLESRTAYRFSAIDE